MRYRRVIIPGATYFFTLNLLNRKSTLLTKHIDILKFAFKKVKANNPFHIDAIVVMPDHLHTIVTLPDKDADYSLRWNLIKGCFSRQFENRECISKSRVHKRERGIWQRRFWEHLIRDESDYIHHFHYILYNPVKHGYVTKLTLWPYSSIHMAIKNQIVSPNWACHETFEHDSYGE